MRRHSSRLNLTTMTPSVKKFAKARADAKLKRYTAVVLGGSSRSMTRLSLSSWSVLGTAGGVGKSALVIRYERNLFLEQYNPTIEGTSLFFWLLLVQVRLIPCRLLRGV